VATADVVPIADHIADLIGALADIGRVYDHDLWHRDDMADLIVSTIDGVPTARAWWIMGPALADPSYLTHSQPANAILRPWAWTVAGLEGLDAEGATAMTTLRGNMLRVIDALDADRNMGGTAHRVEPCRLTDPPQIRQLMTGYAFAYTELTKVVYTLSAP
jgi:hypothetical protein